MNKTDKIPILSESEMADNKKLKEVEIYHSNMQLIASHLPMRTENKIRKRFLRLRKIQLNAMQNPGSIPGTKKKKKPTTGKASEILKVCS